LRVYPTFISVVLKTDFYPLRLSLEYFKCFAEEHYIDHFTSVCRFSPHWGRREESKCIFGCAHNSKIGQGVEVDIIRHIIYTQKSPDNSRLPGLSWFILCLQSLNYYCRCTSTAIAYGCSTNLSVVLFKYG